VHQPKSEVNKVEQATNSEGAITEAFVMVISTDMPPGPIAAETGSPTQGVRQEVPTQPFLQTSHEELADE